MYGKTALILILLSSFNCHTTISNMNKNYSVKTILVINWGEAKSEISPKYISSGFGFEEEESTKLVPVLFHTDAQKNIFIIDANFKNLSTFDKNGLFKEKSILPINQRESISDFEILKDRNCMLLVKDSNQVFQLVKWNFQTDETEKTSLGSYRTAHLLVSKDRLYCWAEKEDYSGELWEFDLSGSEMVKDKITDLPFVASRVFFSQDKILGVKYFEALNKRGLQFADLKTKKSEEFPCSDDLYGALLYPVGTNESGDLYAYLDNENKSGIIHLISRDGSILKKADLQDLLASEIKNDPDLRLTPYHSWKVLSDGSLLIGLMTGKDFRILQLKKI
jgi:hypothetical protein